jgi:glutaredoxin
VPASSELLKILSIAVVPFTIYSLWYQYSVGAWCTLCCIVQALLVIGALTAGLDGLHWWEIRADMTMVPSLLTYIFPVSVWALLKPLLLRAQQIEPLQQQVRKFKYNSKFFSQLLASQKHYAIPDEIMPVVLGSPDAATTITMVSNPFCGPCASAHKLLDKWLKERDDLQVKIVFATANHDDDDRTKVARHVTALSLLEDKSLAADAMNDWYSQAVKQFDEWSARFPVPQDKDITSVTTKQKEWCREAEIMFTPTIFVNGYKLVEPYELEDIRQLID